MLAVKKSLAQLLVNSLGGGSNPAVASQRSVGLIYSCSQQAKIKPVKLCMAKPHFVF